MEKPVFPVFRERTKNIDVTEITRNIYEAEKAQDKANDDLEAASRDRDTTRDRVQDVKIHDISNDSNICHLTSALPDDSFSVLFQIKDKMDNIETKLMDHQVEALKDKIDALKKKTELNRQMARDARETADSVLNNTTDVQTVRPLTHRLLTDRQTTTTLYDNSVFTDCLTGSGRCEEAVWASEAEKWEWDGSEWSWWTTEEHHGGGGEDEETGGGQTQTDKR